MNLEQTAITLADQFGGDGEVSLGAIDRFFQNLGKFAFGGLGAVVVIGIGYLLFTVFFRFILNGSQVTSGIFLILFIVFAALSFAYVVYNEVRKDRKPSIREDASNEIAAANTGKLLNEASQMSIPVPSVVEDTTDLLPVEARTRKL